jgi:sec-independent protein translocase protein TatA
MQATEAIAAGVLQLRRFPPQIEGAVMFGQVGLPELLIIFLILMLIFGANRLPELGRGIGKGIRNFKEATRDGEKGDHDRT